MLKVPRTYVQWIVNIIKNVCSEKTTAVIFIGSEVATLGYYMRGNSISGGLFCSRQAKKRLGSRSSAPSLTQSLALSHIHRILQQINSSSPIAIILPSALFTRISISVPADLSPHELKPTLLWALQQQGFAPQEEWLWDAIPQTETPLHTAAYDVWLIEKTTIEGFLQRLAVSPSRLALLIPQFGALGSEANNLCGPWLQQIQVEQVLQLLHTCAATSRSLIPFRRRLRLTSSAAASGQTLNLACNFVSRITTEYQQAFYQCTLVVSALLTMAGVWWWQPAIADNEVNSNTVSLRPARLPLHPLYHHAHLWQQLHALSGKNVDIKRLEFRRNAWFLQVQTQNLGLADTWITQLREQLSADTSAEDAPHSAWRVLTQSSQSRDGQTLIDLEIHQ